MNTVPFGGDLDGVKCSTYISSYHWGEAEKVIVSLQLLEVISGFHDLSAESRHCELKKRSSFNVT
jgi:hypothetical protein